MGAPGGARRAAGACFSGAARSEILLPPLAIFVPIAARRPTRLAEDRRHSARRRLLRRIIDLGDDCNVDFIGPTGR